MGRVVPGVALLVAAAVAVLVFTRPANRAGSLAASDRDFAAFLDEVKKLTPPDAKIALVVPTNPQAYVIEAAARLAPRAVFLGRESEATYVAAYRYKYQDVKNQGVLRVPHGALFRRVVTSGK